MPGIFLSHSSKDKPFVTRLAIDLVNRGIPVWLDKWELDTGESLIQKIYDGIDESSYLIIVLSPSSTESGWVNRELNAALSKEQSIGRRFILPIKMSECQIPLKIADRLYADFSGGYLKSLEQFVVTLKNLGLHGITIPAQRQLIPLSFTKGLYLRYSELETRVKSLLPVFPANFHFHRSQFVISPDERYSALKDRLIQRLERIEDDPYYTPEFENELNSFYQGVIDLEEQLVDGVRLILDEMAISANLPLSSFGEACHWFTRIMRSRLYGMLFFCQNPEQAVEKEEGWEWGPLDSNHTAAKFFGVNSVERMDVGVLVTRDFYEWENRFSLWIDSESTVVKDLQKYGEPQRILNFRISDPFSKYVIPQMVAKYVRGDSIPLTWDFEDYHIGFG